MLAQNTGKVNTIQQKIIWPESNYLSMQIIHSCHRQVFSKIEKANTVSAKTYLIMQQLGFNDGKYVKLRRLSLCEISKLHPPTVIM